MLSNSHILGGGAVEIGTLLLIAYTRPGNSFFGTAPVSIGCGSPLLRRPVPLGGGAQIGGAGLSA